MARSTATNFAPASSHLPAPLPPPPPGPELREKFILDLSWTASTAMMQMGESMVRLASGQILADYGATKVKPLAPPNPKRLLPED